MDKTTERRWPALMCKLEAAEYLSIGKRSLERLLAEGELRMYQLRDRTLRLKKSDLDRFIDGLKPSSGVRPGN